MNPNNLKKRNTNGGDEDLRGAEAKRGDNDVWGAEQKRSNNVDINRHEIDSSEYDNDFVMDDLFNDDTESKDGVVYKDDNVRVIDLSVNNKSDFELEGALKDSEQDQEIARSEESNKSEELEEEVGHEVAGNRQKRSKIEQLVQGLRRSKLGRLATVAIVGVVLMGGAFFTKSSVAKQNNDGPKISTESDAGYFARMQKGMQEVDDLARKQSMADFLDSEYIAEKEHSWTGDIRYSDGEVLRNMNLTFGGDNTGQDFLDLEHKVGSTALSTSTDSLRGKEKQRFQEAQNNPESMSKFKADVLETEVSHLGNLAPMVFEAGANGLFADRPMTLETLNEMVQYAENDPEFYNTLRNKVQETYTENEKTIVHKITLRNTPYMSFYANASGDMDGHVNLVYGFDNEVAVRGTGTLVDEHYTEDGQNWYDAHPEIKKSILQLAGIISNDGDIDKYEIIGRLPGCMQYGIEKKKETPSPRDSSIRVPRPRKIIPPDENIIPPVRVIIPPDEVLIPPARVVKPPEDEIPPDDNIIPPRPVLPPEEKEIIPPREIIPPDDEIPPDEEIIPPEKKLQEKTNYIPGANERNDQRNVTDTDQSVAPVQGNEQINGQQEQAGAEVQDKVAEQKEVIENITTKDESGEENPGKAVNTAENNRNLNTGSIEKASDAEGRNVVNEPTVENQGGADQGSFGESNVTFEGSDLTGIMPN